MKLKRLTLHGFKSFCDRTELVFADGVAGIVGPNGCGKSNIVDAIRWVMGEQSAKGLRGTEMMDVIFNGTSERKKSGFAEVAVTFDNSDKLAPSPYTDCSEIMISRRLFRTGESEYLINNVVVRLKDITDLFLGTGSSAKAYSIVQQGKIDQIVLAKPEDRRMLIEEAAGIAKYKVRKQSAERKMEATRLNLDQVELILKELEKNSRSLERQVEKAEEFRKLQKELRAIDEQVVGYKISKFDAKAKLNDQELSAAQDILQAATTELQQVEAEIEKGRLEALDQEKVSSSDYERLLRTKDDFSRIDKELEIARHRIPLIQNQIIERQKDIEEAKERWEAQSESIKEQLVDLEKVRTERAEKNQQLEGLRADVKKWESEVSSLEDEIDRLTSKIQQTKQQSAREIQRREYLLAESQKLQTRIAEVKELSAKNSELQTQLLEEQTGLDAQVQNLETELEELGRSFSEEIEAAKQLLQQEDYFRQRREELLQLADQQNSEVLKREIQKISDEIFNIQNKLLGGVKRLNGSEDASDDKKALLQKLVQKQQTCRSNRSGLEGRRQQIQDELKKLEARLSEIVIPEGQLIAEGDLESSEQDLQNKETRLLELLDSKKAAEGLWIEKRIECGALQERFERLQQITASAAMSQSEFQFRSEQLSSDIQRHHDEVKALEAKILDLESRKIGSEDELSRLSAGLAAAKESLAAARSKVEGFEVQRKASQLQKDAAQSKVQQLELERQEIKYQVDELAQLVQERYHISLTDLLEQSAGLDLSALQDETLLGSLEVDSIELREKLNKFGDVNLLALSEYEEIKKRLEFIVKQKEDLLKTLDALQSIIDRINTVTEFRFRETFKAINHNFQLLFPKVFGGGRAYMRLTNENQLLETGVEIFAEPPGKKIQALSLLSGGEKAMAGISLLFALFTYRPSSFCILDEVDAPLDEANTIRYSEIIKDMSHLSQFIVITHSKRTMEMTNHLYGVTMQEPGVSRLVGVNLQEAQAFVTTAA